MEPKKGLFHSIGVSASLKKCFLGLHVELPESNSFFSLSMDQLLSGTLKHDFGLHPAPKVVRSESRCSFGIPGRVKLCQEGRWMGPTNFLRNPLLKLCL